MIAAIYARTSEGRRSRHRACYCLRCEERHERRRSSRRTRSSAIHGCSGWRRNSSLTTACLRESSA